MIKQETTVIFGEGDVDTDVVCLGEEALIKFITPKDLTLEGIKPRVVLVFKNKREINKLISRLQFLNDLW